MGKTVCESCGTEFKFEVVKDIECCPVCGASFDDEGSVDNKRSVQDDGLMYFDEINIDEDEPEYSDVEVYCKKCGKVNLLDLELFDKLVDGEFVRLKKGITVKCYSCGEEHKPRKILYKRKDHYYSIFPNCPACNSISVKKITAGSKFLAAATMGAFAVPYTSKTFECLNCGYLF